MVEQSVMFGALRLVIFFLVLSGLSGCYVSRLAWHQGKLLGSRRDVSEVVLDPSTPASVKSRLQELPGILAFAKSCGLEPGNSYGRYIDNGDRPLSWLVYAAKPDRLESVTWWFPFSGRVPYLGFFSKEERDEEEAGLKSKGYDTAKGSATAFSMLGIIDDPIYRSMTRRSRDEFAHVIFHELVHRTVWVKGSADFNERLAEIFARRVTLAWLDSIHINRGDNHDKINFLADLEDRRKFGVWLTALRSELEVIYKSGRAVDEILRMKGEAFTDFTRNRRPKFVGADIIGGRVWNNAEVLAAGLYDGNDFPCPPEPAIPEKAKVLMAWLGANKNSEIATVQTLRMVCD